MSYCRFLEADVYVFMHVSGYLQCCGCIISETEWGSFNAYDTDTMIAHLKKHLSLKHHVPLRVFDELIADDKENFGEQNRD